MLSERISLGLALALAGLALLSVPPVASAQAVTSTSVFVMGQPDNTVEGASSTLVRTVDGIDFTILTSDLEPNHALTVWVVIFNNPEYCSDSCGADDLLPRGGDPAIDSSVVWGNAGTVSTADGKANFGGYVKVGDTSTARFGPGLLDPTGAEVHMVIRTHGPVVPEMLSQQISTFDEGCPEEVGCVDVQALAHLPFTDPTSVLMQSNATKIDTIMKRLGIFF